MARHGTPTPGQAILEGIEWLKMDKAEFALDDGPWQPEEEILRLEGLLSPTDENSAVCALNRGESVENEELSALLETSLSHSAATSGN